MALPGPFLAGQRLTAGQLNDATQKTIASKDVNIIGTLVSGVTTTETTITQFTLGPFDQVAGALYRVSVRAIIQVDPTTNDAEFRMIMRKNTALTGTIIADWNMWRPPFSGAGFLSLPWADFPSVADETVTYYFSVVRFSVAGTTALTVYGHHTSNTPSGVKIERVGYASEYTVVT